MNHGKKVREKDQIGWRPERRPRRRQVCKTGKTGESRRSGESRETFQKIGDPGRCRGIPIRETDARNDSFHDGAFDDDRA